MNPLAAAYRACGEGVRWVKAGLPLADSQARLEICCGCSRYHSGFCAECHCYMPLKARLATTRCPLGRWVDASA
jgi:hypothetical protein